MKKILVSFLICLVFILQSCTMEYKIAREFVKSRDKVSVYFLPSDHLIKTDKRTNIEDTILIFKSGKDSTSVPASSVINDLSDSIFLETYFNSLFNELYELGIHIYSQELADSFLFRIASPAYMVYTGQVEIEEYDYLFKDKQEFGDYEYFQEITLKGCNINSWLEISELDKPDKEYTVLFDGSNAKDDIFGYFLENIFSGDVSYHYKITPLTIDKFYEHTKKTGIRHAEFIFDYIMNESIRKNPAAYNQQKYYFHYDRRTNTIWPVDKERFQIIE